MSRPSRVHEAIVLTIGDELNRGEILDTNSQFLAERLTDLGAHVRTRVSVTDDPGDLRDAVLDLAARADLVVASGGLGPTDDDRTVDVVSDLLGVAPALDPDHERKMLARFAERGFTVTPNNLRQVRVPAGADVLRNDKGMAPGFAVRLGRAELFFMPGVPREMRPMFDAGVAPRVAARVGVGVETRRRVFRVAGLGESHVDHRLAGLLADTGVADATLHFRILFPETLVTAVVRRASAAEAEAALDSLEAEARVRLGEHLYGTGSDALSVVVGRRLRERGETLALAESCTGGLLGQLVTDPPGASDYFPGGIVAYANEAKVALLGVAPTTLAAHGAVSEEAVREMALGARNRLGATWGIAISGVAGPGGGTPEKPVGTVHLAVAGPLGEAGTLGVEARRLLWPGERELVRQVAAHRALLLLWQLLTR